MDEKEAVQAVQDVQETKECWGLEPNRKQRNERKYFII